MEVTLERMCKMANAVIRRQQNAGCTPMPLKDIHKLALCFVAGVPMEYGPIDENGQSLMTTRVKAGIFWDGRQFGVWTADGLESRKPIMVKAGAA